MSNPRLKQRGPDMFGAEIVIDGKVSATSRLRFDAQAAILDAVMLLLSGRSTWRDVTGMPLKHAELLIYTYDGGRRFHSRVVYSRDGIGEPVCEMKPETA